MRICIANQPRSYREVIAAACRALRPAHEIVLLEPQELDAAISRIAPHLVICSRLTSAIQTLPLTWILLYPEGESLAVFSIAGEETTAADPDFGSIITLIDETARRLA